jgi:SpoVK/Ycf46/Vps4 family AAA+-type ATPase
MARSDLLLNLVRAGTTGNQPLFKQTLEALVAEERANKHTVLAESLAKYLQEFIKSQPTNGQTDQRLSTYLIETIPKRTLAELILSEPVQSLCKQLVEEQHRADLLETYGIEPRNKILLVGPPGNGKTTFAEGLAECLMVPLFTVRYHSVIGSYLGETAVRLRHLFDHVRSRRCVLFFDEFDTVAKERGDLHETGEIKRVVSSLLLEMDALPSYVVVVTATNHPELLDRAVWRRFQIRISLPKPGRREIQTWLQRFRNRLDEKLSTSDMDLSKKLTGLSFAEIEEFGNDVIRRKVLGAPGKDLDLVVRDCLKQWQLRTEAAGPSNRIR